MISETCDCEMCGQRVETRGNERSGIVIEFYSLTPLYVAQYGFCADHRPEDDELDEVKERIRKGLDPTGDNSPDSGD